MLKPGGTKSKSKVIVNGEGRGNIPDDMLVLSYIHFNYSH